MTLEMFCKDSQYYVRPIPAPQRARIYCQNRAPLAGGTALFQLIDVPHLPGDGGSLSILSHSRCRFTSSVITLNS